MYWTEVKNIPSTDLATIERLWNQFSGGKFGYSVQKVSHCMNIHVDCEFDCFDQIVFSPYFSFLLQTFVKQKINLIRKNGKHPKMTLKHSVKRLDGPLKMEMLKERNVGLEHLSSFTM